MNPLYRKMFQQPGASRQPMGILASSPELANVAAQRQPVRMANGGSNTVNRGFIPDMLSRYTTQSVSGSADPNERAFRSTSGMIPLAIESLANRFAAPDVSGSADANERAFRSGEVKSQLGNISEKLMNVLRKYPKSGFAKGFLEDLVLRSKEEQDAVADKLEQQAQSSSDFGDVEAISPGTGYSTLEQGIATMRGVGDVLTTPLGELLDRRTRLAEAADDFDSPAGPVFDSYKDSLDYANLIEQPDPLVERLPGETLEFETYKDTSKTEQPDPLVETKPFSGSDDKGGMPLPKSKPERGSDDDDFDWPSLASEDPFEAMNIVANAQSEGTDKEKAKKTDDALGIKGTLKDRMMQRRALIREMLGEDKAKDIRTDANYNLMMTGLMIAAGQSEDAMTNIATGLAQGLKGFGEAKGEEAQAERKLDRETALLAYQDITAEDKASAERQFQADEAKKKRDFQASENALSRLDAKDRAQLGADTQIKIAELSDSTRKSIAELNRDNQMAIAKLPSKEIQGMLEVFGSNEEVAAYLKAKNSAVKELQGANLIRSAQDYNELVMKNPQLLMTILAGMAPGDTKNPVKVQEAITKFAIEGARRLREGTTGNTNSSPGDVTVLN